jgi:ssDNA-binding Zn-finger/Zn-ribbon topoisomerase 1
MGKESGGWVNGESSGDRWKVVKYHPIRCPDCGSRSHRQYGTEGRLRYHRCKNCEVRYRSWEAES